MNDEPQWNLLPHEPEAFFDLAEGYERKDLKRAYNALIRRYKPEKFPNEFQRIRAAYEQLDQRLRYGRETASGRIAERSQFDWEHREASTPHKPVEVPARRSPSPPMPPVPILSERVKSESPQALFAELAQQHDKSPYDYYCLAVLSDAVGNDDPLSFVKWLLKGLKQHVHEPGLFTLLRAYFQSEVPVAEIPKLLKATSKALSDDRFFFLTEPLWDRLLRAVPFEAFRKLLAECEANLLDHRIQIRLTFYLHILKSACWLADDSWLDDAFELLEENSRFIPGNLESEIEFAWDLREYLRTRREFLNGNPLREQIDQAIREYCTRDAADSDRTFLECQLRMATRPDEVLRAFPLQAPHIQHAFVVWNWIVSDLADRHGTVPNREEYRSMAAKVRRLVKQIDVETDASWYNTLWGCFGWGYILSFGGICLASFLTPFVIISQISDRTTGGQILLATGGGFTCLALFWFLIRPYGVERLRIWLAVRIAKLCYVRLWRRRIVEFLVGTHFLSDDVGRILDDLPDAKHSSLPWMRAFYGQDFALPFFSIAQQFLV